jgi:hypothetical protein
MDPHEFDLLYPHPESAFQMRIPDADADPDLATQKFRNTEIWILIQSSIQHYLIKIKIFKHFVAFQKIGLLQRFF